MLTLYQDCLTPQKTENIPKHPMLLASTKTMQYGGKLDMIWIRVATSDILQ